MNNGGYGRILLVKAKITDLGFSDAVAFAKILEIMVHAEVGASSTDLESSLQSYVAYLSWMLYSLFWDHWFVANFYLSGSK